jgi:hypothetical protein
MPLSLRRGAVTAITEQHDGFVRLEVDGTPCIAYPQLTGPVGVGDDVVVNVQARELELGSGGFDVLYVNLTRGLELPPEPGAHVMKLPYTPLQLALPHGEEREEPAKTLEGAPVVVCSLHSQVTPVCAGLEGIRTAYVQLAGGALPVQLSDAIRALRARALVELTIGAGPAFGGDVDCVNVYSALAVARARGAEAVVCGLGPGVVGTGTALGHGALAAVEALNAAAALGGSPILALRVSQADARERHRGVSHHSRTILELCAAEVAVADESVDASDWRDACASLPLSHMGRGADEDPDFFAAAFAAGRLARSLVR